MARKKKSDPAKVAGGGPPPTLPVPSAEQSLYGFTRDFFTLFGATVIEPDEQRADRLLATLPETLATHFNKSELSLRFKTGELQSGDDLVAHGSRTFDRMLTFLENRSAFTVQRLPVRVHGGEAVMSAVHPLNAAIAGLKLQEGLEDLFFFTFRITYRADDKQQELYTIVLDEQGRWRSRPLAGNAGHALSAPDQLLADAEPAPTETNEAGELLPPRLLPVAQLARLAETARKFAVYHADLRCVTHEAEILPRLYKTLERLTTYYNQQIEEIADGHDLDGEKRRLLESDLQRKISEEIENHRLRVQVELISYVALGIPTASAEIILSDGRQRVTLVVRQNRYSGELERPACHHCAEPLETVTLDRSGHLLCPNCTHRCHGCGDTVCPSCGVFACPVCGNEQCRNCSTVCDACGEHACAGHISRCPTCGDNVCHRCQVACAGCGVHQCRSHLVADCVATVPGEHALICPTCAVSCPACGQATIHVEQCALSGQRFCRNCTIVCAGCGLTVGPGYYERDAADQAPYCRNCLGTCPSCGRGTRSIVTCGVCNAEGCGVCTPGCAVCKTPLCSAHQVRMQECGHILCQEHCAVCAIGHEAVCPICRTVCAICERHYCSEHTEACALCGQEYCEECVRRSGLCDTCANIDKEGVVFNLAEDALAQQREVKPLVRHYDWKRTENLQFVIFLGIGPFFDMAVVVLHKQADGKAQLIHVRQVRALDRLRGFLGI